MDRNKTLTDINEDFEDFFEIIKNDKKYNEKNIRIAFEFAKKAHAFQRRKNGIPFISHPLEVSKIVYSLGLDEASIIASLLHDVVEDTKYSIKDINKEFTKEVSLIVEGLTKIDVFDKNEKYKEKNIETLRKILLASAKDIRILIIKLSDRLHNMRTLHNLKPEKINEIAKETLLIYAPIAQKIGIYSLKWELEDLSFKYLNPEMYQFIKKKLNLKREDRENIVLSAVNELKEFLKDKFENSENIILLGRPKNFYSIYKKIKDKAKDFEDIFDLYAIRIITKNIGDCYTILGLLHESFQSFPNKLKDYIANPKSNGYQSIHTVIFSRAIKNPVEIQIRTEDMHKLAEFGVAAHWKYKHLKEDKKFEKKISWLREVLQWEKENKDSQEFLKLLKFDFFDNEIFVFTPKNDIISLPENASVLDFAYAVHTGIGDKTYKGKVNGITSTIDKVLKSGDIVEIITQKNVRPHEKWLNFVKTSKARSKIRDAVHLKHSGKFNNSKNDENIPFEKLKTKINRLEEFKKVRKCGGCNFKYGDQIVGVYTKKGEGVIHNAKCENAKFTLNKKIPLTWKTETNKQITLTLVLKDRFGILIDILNVVSEFNIRISKLNSKVNKDGSVNMTLKILEFPKLNKFVEKLKKIDSVENIKTNKNIFDF